VNCVLTHLFFNFMMDVINEGRSSVILKEKRVLNVMI
jgi:hypothetical protein